MLKKAFSELVAAVNEVKERVGVFSVQLDGWTDINGEYLINAIKVIGGHAFFEEQDTPQGEKCDTAFMMKTCKALLEDPMCAGFTADNCSGMQDLKKVFLENAAKLKHIAFYVNCMWHGADSMGAALLGLGGKEENEHVLELKTGPADKQWSLDMKKKSALPNVIKGLVKCVKNRSRLRGYFRKLQAAKNAVRMANWRTACKEAADDEVAPPPVCQCCAAS